MQENNGNFGFSAEETRLRQRLIEMGIRQTDVANKTGIHIADVSNVIRGRSKSPRYVEEVYKFLGLDLPKEAVEQKVGS